MQEKIEDLESFVGSRVPNYIEIHQSQCSKTKSSGKWIKGEKEKAMKEQQKRTRHCKTCGQYGYDSHDCPTEFPT